MILQIVNIIYFLQKNNNPEETELYYHLNNENALINNQVY